MTRIPPLIIERHPGQGADCLFPVGDIVQAAATHLGPAWSVGYRAESADCLVGDDPADTFEVGVDTEGDLFVQAIYATHQISFFSNATPADDVDALAVRVADAVRRFL
ncbi:hypothetical protein AB0O57_29680 [Streptomyces sp. NPDC091201]|uniref:hypothetical protein n=1 Tax=Streptomyces sp. NPDC091201 TaxID=3155190 RepID=UPI003422B059